MRYPSHAERGSFLSPEIIINTVDKGDTISSFELV